MSGERRLDPRVARSRAAVLGAALDLLGERGIAGTTVEAVAERSGVARTTIYRQWADQAALVRDAFAATLAEPARPATGTLRGDLDVLVGGLCRAVANGPAASIMPALIDAAERDPAFAELHRSEALARQRVVAEVVGEAVDRGELPAGTDPWLVLDLVAGPVFHRRWVSRGALDEAFARTVVDAALAALPGPPR